MIQTYLRKVGFNFQQIPRMSFWDSKQDHFWDFSKSNFSPEIATITTMERCVIVNDLSMKCRYSHKGQRDIQWNATTIATTRPMSNGQTILSKSFWTFKIRSDLISASLSDRASNDFLTKTAEIREISIFFFGDFLENMGKFLTWSHECVLLHL